MIQWPLIKWPGKSLRKPGFYQITNVSNLRVSRSRNRQQRMMTALSFFFSFLIQHSIWRLPETHTRGNNARRSDGSVYQVAWMKTEKRHCCHRSESKQRSNSFIAVNCDSSLELQELRSSNRCVSFSTLINGSGFIRIFVHVGLSCSYSFATLHYHASITPHVTDTITFLETSTMSKFRHS